MKLFQKRLKIRKWTQQETNKLLEELKIKLPIEIIATFHKRSSIEIRDKIKELEL